MQVVIRVGAGLIICDVARVALWSAAVSTGVADGAHYSARSVVAGPVGYVGWQGYPLDSTQIVISITRDQASLGGDHTDTTD